MDKFINRIDELNQLEKEYAKSHASFTVIYGRRRVGKTALITQFIKDKPNNIYFLATEENEVINRQNFKIQTADFINNPLLKTAEADWHEIFKYLTEYKTDTKKIIVIDEFQYIGMSNSAFPSIMQKVWDTILSHHNIMLIICGSLINMIDAQVLSYNSPLYGRRTSNIKLKQIEFSYYKDFFPNFSFENLVLFYSITGGVPKYIETVLGSKNAYDAIENKILNKQSYLYEEPNFLLSREVREIGTYFSIIKAIALGNRKMENIAKVTGKKATDLSKPLSMLIDLDLIEREVPVTEITPEKSKKGLYRIKDNYISFWFKYVYTYMSNLEKGEKNYVLEQIKKSFIDKHVSFVYEDVCRDKMWKLNNQDFFNFRFNKLGRFWDSSTEIDIVAIDSIEKNMIIGECKYNTKKKGIKVLNELKNKEQSVLKEVPGGKILSYIIFSKSGFTDELIELSKIERRVILIK